MSCFVYFLRALVILEIFVVKFKKRSVSYENITD